MVSPLSVRGVHAPRSGPGSSYLPKSHDLAQPIVGMSEPEAEVAGHAHPARMGDPLAVEQDDVGRSLRAS